LKDKCTN